MKPWIYDLTYQQLEEWLQGEGEPKYRAQQIYEWLYVKRILDFSEMSNLSKALRAKLEHNFQIGQLPILTKQESNDGTIKFLFQLSDGHAIETVIMRHEYGNSICVTTQVGCRIGCTFCASTLGGMVRNLSAGEIVAQIVTAQSWLDQEGARVSHVVVMGIGEPFDNYDNLMNFIRIINDTRGLKIGQRHITVSTSGIIPKIYQFADEGLQVTLAISLHAPLSQLRTQIMPINRAYPLEKLLEACLYYVEKTGRRISFEYALLGGVNDSIYHAERLADLLEGLKCHVNLIPVNEVEERDYVRTPRNKIFDFLHTLEDRGISVTIRREQGSDIAAACGQLRAQYDRAKE